MNRMKVGWLTVLVFGWVFLSCGNNEDDTPEPDGDFVSDVVLINSKEQFSDIIDSKSGDDFDLISAVFHDDYLEVRVAYGGGCEKHAFDVVYKPNDEVTDLHEFAIKHDGNNDFCEAYIHETIRIEFSSFPNALDDIDEQSTIRLINGFNNEPVVIYRGLTSFKESETCELEVTTEDVVCGDGLFKNRWFRYTPNGNNQSILLQPAGLAQLIQIIDDIEEGKYLIGVKLSDPFVPDPNQAICQAFPGPSAPIEIWCIEKK